MAGSSPAPLMQSGTDDTIAALPRWIQLDAAGSRSCSEDPTRPFERAFADLVLGDAEPLVDILSDRDDLLRWAGYYPGFNCNPLFDPLWTDPRFVRIMAEVDIAPCPVAGDWPFLPPR